MSLARLKNWIAGEKLYATDLNAEFNNIISNASTLISPVTASFDLDGNTFIMDAAGATTVISTTAVSWNFSSGGKTGTPGTTGSVANWGAQTYTDSNTAISGTAATYTAHAIKRPTLVATNASVVTTDAATFYIENAPLASTNETITSPWALWTDDGAVRHDLTKTVASAAGAVLRGMYLPAVTETITGSTNITTATGFNLVEVGQPTFSAASAMSVTNAATMYIANAPTGGGAGPATITNAYALWIDSGTTRLDGAVIVGGTFSVQDSSDATKVWNLDVSGIPTANTVTGKVAAAGVVEGAQGANIASAATINLDTATGDYVHITGSTGPVTAITLAQGRQRTVVFDSTPTLTNGASLLLRNGISRIAVAGEVAVFRGESAGVVREVSPITAKQQTRQVFTSSSGTYTTPSGVTRINVRLIGAGGGGSGSGTGGGTGGAGGNTTFSTLTGTGGSPASQQSAGNGGAASGGDFNIVGGSGGGFNSPVNSVGGSGGNGPFGGGGGGGSGFSAVTPGRSGATNSGGGGGGAGSLAGAAGSGAGGGAGGYVEKLILTPAATYSYGVGAAGTAGTAGTSGDVGGAGGSGLIVVDEFYV